MSSCLILSRQRQIGILSKGPRRFLSGEERAPNVAARFIVPLIAGLINQTATKSAECLIQIILFQTSQQFIIREMFAGADRFSKGFVHYDIVFMDVTTFLQIIY